MNFTKEYIDLCKNDKLQGLRTELQFGDIVLWKISNLELFGLYCLDGKIRFDLSDGQAEYDGKKGELILLYRGDQLDEEITKILAEMSKNGEDLSYDVGVSFMDGSISAWQVTVSNRDYEHTEMEVDLNLAKLKLLVALLENKQARLPKFKDIIGLLKEEE